MPLTRTFFAAVALIACSAPAFAQVTIDHNKALAGGSLPGDTAGYPITISQPGHYKLMSNLVVPADTDGLVVKADDVTIELNGFRIIGPTLCTPNWMNYTTTCPGGVSTGIRASEARGTRVQGGAVEGFHAGVRLLDGRVVQTTLRHNNAAILLIAVDHQDQAGAVLLSELNVSRNGTGIGSTYAMGNAFFVPHGMIERSVFNKNTRAVDGQTTLALRDSTVTGNNIGVLLSPIRGNLIVDNKTNTLSASAF